MRQPPLNLAGLCELLQTWIAIQPLSLYTKLARPYTSSSTKSASLTKERWRTLALLIKPGTTSSEWATNLPIGRRHLISLSLYVQIDSSIDRHPTESRPQVTDPNGRIPRPGVTNLPRTASDFAEYFNKSPQAQANRDDIESYKYDYVGRPDRANAYKQSALAEHAKNTRKKSYALRELLLGLI